MLPVMPEPATVPVFLFAESVSLSAESNPLKLISPEVEKRSYSKAAVFGSVSVPPPL